MVSRFCHVEGDLPGHLATKSPVLASNPRETLRLRSGQEWGTHQCLVFEAAVSQTRSDAAGPRETVPSGVTSVRVLS